MHELPPPVEALSGIPVDGLYQLLGQARKRTFGTGSDLMRQGDVSDCMYVIVRGRVRVERTHPALTVPLMLAELGRGEVVGEMGILDRRPRSATVKALEPTEALEVTAEAIAQALEQYPAASRGLLGLLTRRLRSTDELVEEMARRRVS